MYSSSTKRITTFFTIVLALLLIADCMTAGTKKFTVEDAMKFTTIKYTAISDNGSWVGYHIEPDRGDPTAYIKLSKEFENDVEYIIERGVRPKFTNDSKWSAVTVKPSKIEQLNADKGDKPDDSLALFNLTNGERTYFEKIKSFKFSEDSQWMAMTLAGKGKKNSGSEIMLRHLTSGSELLLSNVTTFSFDTTANYLVYAVSTEDGKRNGLYYIKLQGLFNFPQTIIKEKDFSFSNLTWNDTKSILAFIAGKKNKDDKPDSCALYMWDSRRKELNTIIDSKDTNRKAPPEGWILPFKNDLTWTKDGDRLFFGFKPYDDTSETKPKIKYNDSNFYNIDTIMNEHDLDLWHWNDPFIKTNEKTWWRKSKDRVFMAVYHMDADLWVQLATKELEDVYPSENSTVALGLDDLPYRKEITWNGWFRDVYEVNLLTGEKTLVVKKTVEYPHLSPNGQYIAYYKDKNWYSYDSKSDTTYLLNEQLKSIPFYNVIHDEPSDPPSYGFAGWLEGDKSMLVYDQYDIWKFHSDASGYLNLTAAEGRLKQKKFRVLNLDRDKQFFKKREDVLCSGYDDIKKTSGLFRINLSILGPETVIHEDNKLRVSKKAKGTYKLLYTKQTYSMFPDLWVSDSIFHYQLKVSDVHPELEEYNFGKTELISWVNAAGDSLRGWIIKPENMEEGKQYPMLVYFYDKFSDYYNQFFTPRLNHRPCYPIYTGKGYVIFHPDMKYRDGNPGFQSTDCIVSGVRDILKDGYIDSTKIGIQGHSWGGYQTAFIITQTDLFAAAVAGAPVSNMTSAYSGIRWGTGLARQFQYEKFQSRIGGTLWDSLDNYLNNSPVMQAQAINTPFMLMFGDDDWAVPWEQGIELYLAMRRLNKQCIFLQYRKEPHWPEKYPNKVDYSIKMMQFYDHFILGEPAPNWLTEGIKFRGR